MALLSSVEGACKTVQIGSYAGSPLFFEVVGISDEYQRRGCVCSRQSFMTYTHRTQPVTKFLRDTLDWTDLPGTKPRIPFAKTVRDGISVADIAGAQVRLAMIDTVCDDLQSHPQPGPDLQILLRRMQGISPALLMLMGEE